MPYPLTNNHGLSDRSLYSPPYLGVAIGTDRFAKEFIEEKVKECSAEVLLLAKIAEGHAATRHLFSLDSWSFQQVVVCVSYFT